MRTITLNKVAPYDIGLGFLCNLRSLERTFIDSGLSPSIKTTTIQRNEKRVDSDLTDQLVQAALKIANVDVDGDVAQVAVLYGAPWPEWEERGGRCRCVKRAFRAVDVSHTVRVEVGDLTPDKFARSPHQSTHVVTSITYGKSFAGVLSLTSRDLPFDLLSLAISSVPIGGPMDTPLPQNCVFQANVCAGTLLSTYNSLDTFLESAQHYLEQETKQDIVQFTIEPLEGLKGLQGAVTTPFRDFLNIQVKSQLCHFCELNQFEWKRYPSTAVRKLVLQLKEEVEDAKKGFFRAMEDDVGTEKLLKECSCLTLEGLEIHPKYCELVGLVQGALEHKVQPNQREFSSLDVPVLLEHVQTGKFLQSAKGTQNGCTIWARDYSNKESCWVIQRGPNGTYLFCHLISGRYINLSGGNVKWGVQLWDNPQYNHCHWNIQEQGDTISIHHCSSKEAMVVDNGCKNAQGEGIRWRVRGYHIEKDPPLLLDTLVVIQNHWSGRYLNLSGGSTANGTKVIQWDNPHCNESHWMVVKSPVADCYLIYSPLAKSYLNHGGTRRRGQEVVIWNDSKSHLNIQWKFHHQRGHYYSIRCFGEYQFALNVSGADDICGAPVILWDNPDFECSQWLIKRAFST